MAIPAQFSRTQEAEWVFYFLCIVRKFLEFITNKAKDCNDYFLMNSIGTINKCYRNNEIDIRKLLNKSKAK